MSNCIALVSSTTNPVQARSYAMTYDSRRVPFIRCFAVALPPVNFVGRFTNFVISPLFVMDPVAPEVVGLPLSTPLNCT